MEKHPEIKSFKDILFTEQISQSTVFNHPNEKYIRINTFDRQFKSIFIEKHVFNSSIIKFINNMIANKKYKTHPEFNFQIINANNIIYLDGDWYQKYDKFDKKQAEKDCIKEANHDKKYCIDELERMNKHIEHALLFTPYDSFPTNDLGEYKLGYHCFVICQEDIDSEERIKVFNNIKNNGGNHVDINPIQGRQVLLPFATKPPRNGVFSRRYKYQKNNSIFKPSSKIFCNDSIQNISEIDATQLNIPVSKYTKEEYDDEDDTDDINLNDINLNAFGKANLRLFEFIQSLKYLRKQHSFWNKLSENDYRLRYIQKPIMDMIYINYFLEFDGKFTIDNNKMVKIMLKLMQPLLVMTIKPNEQTDRASTKSISNHVRNWFSNYGTNKMLIVKKSDYVMSLKDMYQEYQQNSFPSYYFKWIQDNKSKYDTINGTLWKYREGKLKLEWISSREDFDREAFDKTRNYPYWTDGQTYLCPYLFGEIDENKISSMKNAGNERVYLMEILSRKIRKRIESWISFIKIIINGISDEIIPYDENENILPFEDEFSKENNTFINTLRTWCSVFISMEYYQTKSLSDAIRVTMNAFTKKFVYKNNADNTLLIYNIKQTKSLEEYPYNQWINTSDGMEQDDEFTKWITIIYDRLIRHLITNPYIIDNIHAILNIFTKANIGLTISDMRKIKPFDNIGNDIRTIKRNIISTINNIEPPKEVQPADTEFFPMRNGWLEWIKDSNGKYTGEYKFHTNTYKYYISRHTQITYDENYNKNNDCYESVMKVIEQIYPSEEIREYMLNIYSSVLIGQIQKDLFMILYGTGSDGKTTIINALQAMLAGEGFGENATVTENNKRIKLNMKNIKGLSSTMKTDTILSSNNKSNHDEGGLVEAVDVRLCNTQEPETSNGMVRLNSSNIKLITSGTTVTTRRLYKQAVSKPLNTLVIMQTNHPPITDDTTNGFRRRLSYIVHESKFVTNETDEYKHHEHVYQADSNAVRNLCDNPLCWQAMFYILLSHAQNMIKTNKKFTLSSFPRPEPVERYMKDYFEHNSSTLNTAINKIVIEISDNKSEFGVISFTDIVDKLDNLNNDKFAGICSGNKIQRTNKLREAVKLYFQGKLYRLSNKKINGELCYYNTNSKKKYTVKDIDFIKEALKANLTNEGFKDKYLRAYSAELETKPKDGIYDNSDNDVFIYGYKYNPEHIEE